jgi:hypothetical protein
LAFLLQKDFRARVAWIVRHSDGLLFSLGVDAADADQARISGSSKEYNFVFSAFVVVFLGCFLISDSQMWFLNYDSGGFLVLCAQARSEPNLRVLENAGRPYESL